VIPIVTFLYLRRSNASLNQKIEDLTLQAATDLSAIILFQ
jgi:hypothetical protein